MKKGLCCVVVILAGTACSLAKADEVTDLKDQLAAQERQTAEIKQRIDQLEARQKIKEKAASEKLAEVEKKAAEKKDLALPDSLKWVETINLSGDFRFRYEMIDQEGSPQRDRQRIRARVGLAAKANSEWDVGLRLATGEGVKGGDPVSTNQTLGQAWARKPLWLDNAFLNYHPAAVKGLSVTAGKFDMPFYAVGRNQLTWDHDLTPEGGAIRYTLPLSKQTKVTVNGGGFWIVENSAAADPALWGAQGYLEHSLDKSTVLLGGVSFYGFGHLKGAGALNRQWDGTTSDKFFGNTSAGGLFANDYSLVEPFAELGTRFSNLPVSVFGSWVTNTAAESASEDSGWLVGFKLNKAADPKTWEFAYDYRDVGKDAVVGQFNDSDFIGGGTGGRGHRFNLVYQVAKNVQGSLTYYADTITRTSTDVGYNRFQADVVVKFK